MSAPPLCLELTDARLILLVPGWTSLCQLADRVDPLDQAGLPRRLDQLVRLGLLERRRTSRMRLEWRRSALTWRAAVVGQLGFVWVDGGPVYVRLVASMPESFGARSA